MEQPNAFADELNVAQLPKLWPYLAIGSFSAHQRHFVHGWSLECFILDGMCAGSEALCSPAEAIVGGTDTLATATSSGT